MIRGTVTQSIAQLIAGALAALASVSSAAGPSLRRFRALDMDERWLNRSPETMPESFHWFQG
jgi:hypothetical protein